MALKEECQCFKILSVVLQDGFSHDAQAGSSELLPLHVALYNGLHSLLQQLVHRWAGVYQVRHVPTPLGQTQLVTPTQDPGQNKRGIRRRIAR